MRFDADAGSVTVEDRDIVRLVNGRIGVVTSVRQPSVREEFVGKLAINVTAKTEHEGIFERLTVTPQAIAAVRSADGETWFSRSGDEIKFDGSEIKGKAVNLADATENSARAMVQNGLNPNGSALNDFDRANYIKKGWTVGVSADDRQ